MRYFIATLALLVLCLSAFGQSFSGGGWSWVPASASCPFGTALADGCPGAQASGITPRPAILTPQTVASVSILTGSGYNSGGPYTWTSSGGGCSVNASGTVTVTSGYLGGPTGISYTISNPGSGCTSRPTISIPAGAAGGSHGSMIANVYQATPHNASTPWNMPGVDYPVGYDRTLTLKDPTVQGNLPSGATVSGNAITISSNNVTLNGFDFCGHSEATLTINANVTGYVVSNNSFCGPPANGETVDVGDGSSGIFKYNDFNGLAVLGGAGSPNATGCGGGTCGPNGSLCCGGPASFTFEYNYCYQQDSKCFQLSGLGSGTGAIIEKYNLFDTVGNCPSPDPCAHGEEEYQYGSGTTAQTVSFNTYYNPFHCSSVSDSTGCPAGNSENVTANSGAFQADALTINGVTMDHNVALSPGPQSTCNASNTYAYTSSAVFYIGQQEGGTLENVTIANNYADNSGTFFVWYTGGTNITYSGNLDAGSGGACDG